MPWLFKSEPDQFSIHDLSRAPKRTTCWDGVRNYQARNFMRDQMRVGDRALFYHSSCETPAVVGTVIVAKAAYPDHTAWDKKSDYHDPKASPENPIWMMVDIRLEQIFPKPLPLEELKRAPKLAKMELLRRGSRLSIQPVTDAEFDAILALSTAKAR